MMSKLRWLYLLSMILLVFLLIGCTGDEDNDSDDDENDDGDDPEIDEVALQAATDLADTWMRYFTPGQNAWSWDSGVMMMGFLALSDLTGNEDYFDYARQWIDHHIEFGYHIASSDTSIPGFTALQLYHRTYAPKYLKVAHQVWVYIQLVAGRTSDGGLNHMGWLTGNQLWVDTLFMIGPFLIDYADLTQDEKPYQEFALQLQVFRKRLQNKTTGLYHHRYDDDTKEQKPAQPLFWGRGNGWVFAASSLAASQLPESIQNEMNYDLQSDLSRMLESITSYEEVDGRFHTILNRSDTYLETSAGLLFAYGLCLDMLGKQTFDPQRMALVERWIQGAMDQIVVDDGGYTLLLGTSYGTSPGDVAYYNQVLKGENVSYGLGLFLLAVTSRQEIGILNRLDPSPGMSDETFVSHPVPCQKTACGKFHMTRGNFKLANSSFKQALSDNPLDSEAHFFGGLIDLIGFVFEVLAQMDRLYIGETDLEDLLKWLTGAGSASMTNVSNAMNATLKNPTFSSTLDRLLMLEGGGHSAFGQREYDRGEALIIDAIAQLIKGIARLLDVNPALLWQPPASTEALEQTLMDFAFSNSSKSAKPGLESMLAGLDQLILGIETILAETDDQSDDLIPSNLFRLTGTFGIPGVLPEDDVMDILVGFGLPREFLESLDMPEDLLGALESITSILKWVIRLLGS